MCAAQARKRLGLSKRECSSDKSLEYIAGLEGLTAAELKRFIKQNSQAI